jgi:4-hydroxybenzoate polyprenyltransferase
MPSMPNTDKEKKLLLVSIGVIVLTVLAVITFILGVNIFIFYACAILAIALGFYLSFSLSKQQPSAQQKSTKKK